MTNHRGTDLHRTGKSTPTSQKPKALNINDPLQGVQSLNSRAVKGELSEPTRLDHCILEACLEDQFAFSFAPKILGVNSEGLNVLLGEACQQEEVPPGLEPKGHSHSLSSSLLEGAVLT